MSRPTLGILIRFANSSATLPDVLQSLKNQTLQPDVILGVDSGSSDGSDALIRQAGGQVISWRQAYEHSKVLNFGTRHLQTDLVLVLSSHTVLEDPETVARMLASMSDPRTACVSLRWDSDPFYSDAIDWRELCAKGVKFGSIYSNSMGMFRRRLWVQHPFDEAIETSEDYAWAVHQLKLGHTCRRLALPFRYRRSGHNRDFEFAKFVFLLGRKHGLKVTWLGLYGTLTAWAKGVFSPRSESALHRARLAAFCYSRLPWAK